MTDNTDLKELEELWHGIGGGRDAAKDVARAKRRCRRERIFLVTELVISTLGVVAGIWFFIDGDPLTGICAIAFSLLGAASAWTVRRANMRTLTESVSDHLEAQARLRTVALRQHAAGLLIAVAALLFLLVARRDIDPGSEPVWLPLLPVALVGLGIYYAVRIWRAKHRDGIDD